MSTPITSTPIYLGSQTLLERDGTWLIEHRDHNDQLTRTETIGNDLDLNFRLLGIAGRLDDDDS